MDTEALNPARRANAGPAQQVKLEADAKVSDITIGLTPNSSIGGRILDEDGVPLAGCQAMLMQNQERQGTRRLDQRSDAPSDENGDYKFADIQPGKYFVMGRCFPIASIAARLCGTCAQYGCSVADLRCESFILGPRISREPRRSKLRLAPRRAGLISACPGYGDDGSRACERS